VEAAEPPRAHIPATITSGELADALFGSQASQYANEVATPSNEAIAANGGPPAQSEAVAAGSEPPAPSEAVAGSSQHRSQGEETAASRAAAAPSGGPPPATVAAAIEPAPLIAHAEAMIVTAPNPPARERTLEPTLPSPPSAGPSVPSKTPDPAARAQAERFVEQGDRQFANGNVAIARQYFARAVDLGFAPAALKLAETFDAKVLARRGVHGVRPDSAEVEKWRRRAAELGQ
jgi:hypothetical protein